MAARKPNLRSRKTSAAVAKAKPRATRVTPKTKVKAKPAVKAKRKVTPRRKPVAAPIITVPSIPTVRPFTQTVPEPTYKEVHAAQPKRFKLWLTVGLSMAVIVCLWAYSLTQSLLNSSALEDTSKELELGNFVDDIGSDLTDLKTQTNTFINKTENKNTVTTIETNNEADQPNNQQLDNLFSDIQ